MVSLTVDTEAIHLLTRHLRTAAAEITPEHALLVVPDDAFESPVASALATSNADFSRQSGAVAEFVTSLAEAGRLAAQKIVELDASLAVVSMPGTPSGPGRASGL